MFQHHSDCHIQQVYLCIRRIIIMGVADLINKAITDLNKAGSRKGVSRTAIKA
jgi:hypothetical protein